MHPKILYWKPRRVLTESVSEESICASHKMLVLALPVSQSTCITCLTMSPSPCVLFLEAPSYTSRAPLGYKVPRHTAKITRQPQAGSSVSAGHAHNHMKGIVIQKGSQRPRGQAKGPHEKRPEEVGLQMNSSDSIPLVFMRPWRSFRVFCALPQHREKPGICTHS